MQVKFLIISTLLLLSVQASAEDVKFCSCCREMSMDALRDCGFNVIELNTKKMTIKAQAHNPDEHDQEIMLLKYSAKLKIFKKTYDSKMKPLFKAGSFKELKKDTPIYVFYHKKSKQIECLTYVTE